LLKKIVGRADDLAKAAVAVPLVETGCLKRHGIDKRSSAIAPSGLVLGEADDATPNSGAAQFLG